MKATVRLSFYLVVVIAAIAYAAWREPPGDRDAATPVDVQPSRERAGRSLSTVDTAAGPPRDERGATADVAASGNLGSLPARANPAAMPGAAVGAASGAVLPGRAAADVLRERDLRAFHDRLSQDPSPAPAVKAALAQALEECRRIARAGSTVVRERMLQTMTGPNPAAPERQQAIERVIARCAGFEGQTIDEARIRRLWDEAEAEGDARARSRRFVASWMAKPEEARLVEAAKPLLASKDPRVVEEIGSLLAGRGPRPTLADGERPSPAAWNAAWQLAACSFGGDCGPDSRALLDACWSRGICGASSLEEAVARGNLSAEQYQNALRYRDMIVAAIDNGDWGALGLADPPAAADPRARFGAQSSDLSARAGASVRVTQRGGRYQLIIESDSPAAIEEMLLRLR